MSKIFVAIATTLYCAFIVTHQCSQDVQPAQIMDLTSSGLANGEYMDQIRCSDLSSDYTKCDFNTSCIYGQPTTVRCHADENTLCKGDRSFDVTFPCLYCWQTPEDKYTCTTNTTCHMNARYLALCIAKPSTYCLGNRVFSRYRKCSFVSGYKWSTAVVLSVLFGGLGLDRFYLGHWQEGIGKLFSFGGFGVWTLVDSILVTTGYLKPSDSSHYVDLN